MCTNRVLLFGSQALSFAEEDFLALRSTILKTPCHGWMLDVISELPSCLEAIAQQCHALVGDSRSSLAQLEDLQKWFATGRTSLVASNLANIALTPLVVLTQLMQYAEYERTSALGEIPDHVSKRGETLGLCTGFLSALVTSLSTDQESFEALGSVAVRLGMLMGLVVDAQNTTYKHGPSTSFATIWHSMAEKQSLMEILSDFAETYISVFYDENRATVTGSASSAPALLQQMRASGITCTEIRLDGRFHWHGHRDAAESLLAFCMADKRFQFPDASHLIQPIRSSIDARLISKGHLTSEAIRSILLEPARWFESVRATHDSQLLSQDSEVLSFGLERCVPPSLLRILNQQVLHLADQKPGNVVPTSTDFKSLEETSIAVVGMACKTAGADDLDEFWDLLCAGKSQHQPVPEERFTFETVHREHDPQKKWYGNFMNDLDMFDHKFFKKTPRESVSMDPQQRQILQIAYQATQQSGYFLQPMPDRHVGCYIGLCSTDYEDNIACHAPTAYTATGHLRGFVAGKVSHFFGWTGPGLTIDTACSSSAVAVHQACQAIRNGECNSAIAGGSHVMSSPLWYQNLAGAAFLSKTGACKPFDADADGYCRGEGVAAVFLKKLSTAIADGDKIIGVIGSSAVQQNENCTPIVQPNVPSLSGLFKNVLQKAQLKPEQVTVVEAHGTGTPVGDPAEFESVRCVFESPKRSSPLALGSVKGLVGHCECTSGIISLIKILLMIQKGQIPPQASFKRLNPAIQVSEANQIQIATSVKPWSTSFRAGLINNYGASGSNASMVITQAPRIRTRIKSVRPGTGFLEPTGLSKVPIWFGGLDDRSLRAYAAVLRKYIGSQRDAGRSVSLQDLAFSLSRQSNRTLPRCLQFSAQTIDELKQHLAAFEKEKSTFSDRLEPRPVVLCFGGQISRFVGLDRQIYDSVSILRGHLDHCNTLCVSLRIGSIYPDVFQRTPVEDVVKLQTCLFALQYSCAKAWLDCGIQPAAVVGHSFGELTSLCVAGILSVEDGLKAIAARARVIRDAWGPDKGAMMAVEANLESLEGALRQVNQICTGYEPAVIACYNGPTAFTLAGSNNAIDTLAAMLRANPSLAKTSKKLSVSNAFHSTYVEPLMASLQAATSSVQFQEPEIRLERCTEHASESTLHSGYFADHLRMPVFFSQSVHRLAQEFPRAVWLEAGSSSTITSMASRALSMPSNNHFQSVNITSENARNNLADATLALWVAGIDVNFWGHHAMQASEYAPMLLPPYQFERCNHWLMLKKPPQAIAASLPTDLQAEKLPETLTTFVGYQDKDKRCARFRVNTMIPEYERLMKGHTVAFTAPICPATVQLDLAIESLRSLLPAESQLQPQIQNIQNEAPICTDKAALTWLDFEVSSRDSSSWTFRFSSTYPQKPGTNVTHTKAEILLHHPDDPRTNLEFARFERLTGHRRCHELLNDPNASSIISGRSIYKTFSEVVDYDEQYQGIQKIAGNSHASAARITKKYDSKTWFDAHLSDTFCQVVGIWVNYMTDRPFSSVYIARAFERWARSPKLDREILRPDSYDVFACHQGSLEEGFLTDVFVFHPITGQLLEYVLGVQFVKIAKTSLIKMLTRLTNTTATAGAPPSRIAKVEKTEVSEDIVVAPIQATALQAVDPSKAVKAQKKKVDQDRADVLSKLKGIMAELSGIEAAEIVEATDLADIGIDSLMGMELITEIERAFKCTLPLDEIAQVTDVAGTLQCVQATLSSTADLDSSEEDSPESVFDKDKPSTPGETDDSTSPDEADANPFDLPKEVSTNDSRSDLTTKQTGDLIIPAAEIYNAFKATKAHTDQFLVEGGCDDYVDSVLPQQNNLCIALTLEAFDSLGSNIKSAKAGERVRLFEPLKEHTHLLRNLCRMLETDGRLIDVKGDIITRTDTPYPALSGHDIMQDPTKISAKHYDVNQLIYFVGRNLGAALSGETDGVKLIFGNPEGRDLVSKMYGDWIMNRPCYRHMEDFLTRLVSALSPASGPLRILEMGAGTGGTTKWIVPLLASLNYPVEYTFTDLAPSLVAAARKRFKQYPFMTFRNHDIEKEVAPDLQNKYHVVIASNAIHATHNLVGSVSNVKKALLPNGVLMMLEMIEPLYWVDMIFGLFEGWWLFDDGRGHALTPTARWRNDLQAAGFGYVDWTEGDLLDSRVNKVIVAVAGAQDLTQRQAIINDQVYKNTFDFVAPVTNDGNPPTEGDCVLVTGATGSTGSHIVADLARRTHVRTIVCLNRRGDQDALSRQIGALSSRGINLSEGQRKKLRPIETDTSKPHLGLSENGFSDLIKTVTHVIHNAWPMSIKRSFKGFEAQFSVMRNLIDLTREAVSFQPSNCVVHFLFVSSIAVVGEYPIWAGDAHVPEERMPLDAALDIGYADAKYACEQMLDRTLHRFPQRFRATAVRVGQIAGSRSSGYWNPQEHLAYLWKSSQTVGQLPALSGPMSWTPVDDVAGTLVDLVLHDRPCPVYNIDNPVRQRWSDTMPVIADALAIPHDNIVPFKEWVAAVRAAPTTGAQAEGNPAAKLIDFLESKFLRMSCGGLLLQTTKATSHSPTLRGVGPVSAEATRAFFAYWKGIGFLN